jgi:hypothetical protein
MLSISTNRLALTRPCFSGDYMPKHLIAGRTDGLSMPPGPARAQIEFSYAIGRGIRIVKSLSRKHDPQLSEESVKNRAAVGQPWKFHPVPIDVLNKRILTRHHQLSQSPQFVQFTSKELNQLVGVINWAGVNDHASIIFEKGY